VFFLKSINVRITNIGRGLALLGLDVVIFISSNMAAVVRAGRFSI
jgi:hypothetical protein